VCGNIIDSHIDDKGVTIIKEFKLNSVSIVNQDT
jgi:hypothetical protein